MEEESKFLKAKRRIQATQPITAKVPVRARTAKRKADEDEDEDDEEEIVVGKKRA